MKNDRAIADERVAFDRAPFKVNNVADDAIVTDDCWSGWNAVNDGAVLDRRALADSDSAVVTAQHRAGPHRAVGANGDVADNDGFGMHPRVGMNIGNHVAQGVNSHDLERHPAVATAEEHKCSAFVLDIEIGHGANDDVVIAAIEHRMEITIDISKHAVNERCAVT